MDRDDLDLEKLGAAAVLDALSDGVYVTDCERKILFWNEAAQKITGWKREEVVGRSCWDDVLVHIDKDGHRLCGHEFCPLHRSIVTGKRSGAPLTVFAQTRSGERVPVEVVRFRPPCRAPEAERFPGEGSPTSMARPAG